MADRLPEIRRELAQIYAVGGFAPGGPGPYPLSQMDWLVGEVERLRENPPAQSCDRDWTGRAQRR